MKHACLFQDLYVSLFLDLVVSLEHSKYKYIDFSCLQNLLYLLIDFNATFLSTSK